MPPALSDLPAALADDRLTDWLAQVTDLPARQAVRRAVTMDRALTRRLHHPTAPGTDTTRPRHGEPALRFSDDGTRLASFIAPEWWVWDLDRGEGLPEPGLEEVTGFGVPEGDWQITGRGPTTFHHRPTGARIVLPLTGPWKRSPVRPEVVASDAAHLILRE